MRIYFKISRASGLVPEGEFNRAPPTIRAGILLLLGSGILAAVIVQRRGSDRFTYLRLVIFSIFIFIGAVILTVFLDFTAVNSITF